MTDRDIQWEPIFGPPDIEENWVEVLPTVQKLDLKGVDPSRLDPAVLEKIEAMNQAMEEISARLIEGYQLINHQIINYWRAGIRALEDREVSPAEFSEHASVVTHPDGHREYKWHDTVVVTQRTNQYPPSVKAASFCFPSEP